jgi:hypothetical protein
LPAAEALTSPPPTTWPPPSGTRHRTPPRPRPDNRKRFELERAFPDKDESRRLRRRIFGQIYHNQGFFLITAAIYALVAMAVPAHRLFDRPTGGWLQTVAAVLPVTLAGLGLFAALYAFTATSQVSRRRKRATATLHTLLHLTVVVGVVDLLLHLSGIAGADWANAWTHASSATALLPSAAASYAHIMVTGCFRQNWSIRCS